MPTDPAAAFTYHYEDARLRIYNRGVSMDGPQVANYLNDLSAEVSRLRELCKQLEADSVLIVDDHTGDFVYQVHQADFEGFLLAAKGGGG